MLVSICMLEMTCLADIPQNRAVFNEHEHRIMLDSVARMIEDVQFLLIQHDQQYHGTIDPASDSNLDLLTEFRLRYHRFQLSIAEAVRTNVDSTILARLGDDLDEYQRLVIEASYGFHNH